MRIIRRAGLEPWPRPFHNLRASCETDRVQRFPLRKVARWIGNTPTVAMRHYVDVTDEDFRQAVQGTSRLDQKKVRNWVRCVHELGETEQKAQSGPSAECDPKCCSIPPLSSQEHSNRKCLPVKELETSGLEPPTPGLQSRCSPS